MRLDFFPSRTLTLYLAKMFIVRIAAVLVMLITVLMALDLLSNSGKIMAVEGNGQAEILTYLSLRIPQMIARFLPYSVLLATIITLAGLNANSEVIAMKASGLSAHQVLAPLILTATVIAGLSFAFNERVVTRAAATLEAWKAVDFGEVPTDDGLKRNIYMRSDNAVLYARIAGGRGEDTVMRGVTWYELDPNGMLTSEIRAERATYAAPGWRLENAQIFRVASASETVVEDAADAPVVGTDIGPEEVGIENVDGEAETLAQLADSIEALEAAGKRTDELRAIWWHKISGPMAAILMPLLGAVAAFGLARSGQLFLRAVIGMSLGFAYFVVDNAALAIGNFGGYPPLLAAWAPFVLFALVGETVLIRTEE
ncbi:LPS export ABC transporter permease LptG [Alteriqipengyuania sp. WL0013]|uniref:LPS export ABC transporter permease LptG n=1 Tax=Alteriqipengyuania sp. WL0013 TaxID=3110773 RepID=UPI002D16B8B9|nr:LPS export ABC transporter permease LptG [Alteriqipengyuania sp. WL0013]MEB3416695.1 LPS export ABC transporter permease LptG [Alteriqipengyuania sp. WL0013]